MFVCLLLVSFSASLSLSVCLSVSVCVLVCFSVYLCVCLSICLSIDMFVSLSVSDFVSCFAGCRNTSFLFPFHLPFGFNQLHWSFTILFNRGEVVVVVVDFFFSSRFTALLTPVIPNEWQPVLYSAFLTISTELEYLQRCLVVTWLVPQETAAISARFVYTTQPCTMSRHFMQSHIRRVHV